MSDFLRTLTNLNAQALLQNQLAPGDPQILVLVLSPDRQAVLDCELSAKRSFALFPKWLPCLAANKIPL